MSQFQFKEGLILDFGEVQYEIHPDDPDFMEVFDSECKRCGSMSDQLRAYKGDDTVSAIRKACDGVKDVIDHLLGDGAVSEIFGGRAAGFYDLLDVFNYIVSESSEYRKQRQVMASPAPANRDQRRAAGKAAKTTAKKVVNITEAEEP